MERLGLRGRWLGAAAALAALANLVVADDVLQTTGFDNCNQNMNITVQKVDISYNADNKTVTFDVAGTNTVEQRVTALLNVTAYGQQIYSNSFDPCANSTYVQQLCPVPAGSFSAQGTQAIPAQYASLVPSIAFQIPDIAAQATLQLRSESGNQDVACIQSQVSNGKTASVPAVSFVAASVAGAALVLTGVSAAGAAFAGAGGSAAAGAVSTIHPGFVEVFSWFQGMAMNGMLSVNYPQVYRSFTKNFAFSTGLIPWNTLQISIDNFRAATGGNLTGDSVQFLQNATLVFPDGSIQQPETNSSSILRVKRALDQLVSLASREITTSVNGSSAGSGQGSSGGSMGQLRVAVSGIQAYVEELSIPSANTFMTVLLIVAIVIAAIAVGTLLVKVVLEIWALFGSFPKSLAGFRKHYWGSIARAITNLILLLYGVWVLYCIFQFTNGDSWAAKALAGVTLALFTGILAFFSYKIWSTARRLKKLDGDTSAMYEDKSIWVKYSLFYESYKRSYWWIFVPTIFYMFAKGCILAAADGHGLIQTVAQLFVEAVMLILLLWSRPYERRSGNIINIVIQVVRVLSVVSILVFVEEFGIAQTTQTVTGVVLIAVQSAMTGVLAILIIWNALIACCKENPHRKRRKEMEKIQRDMDTLTPLDARNSLLMDRSKTRASATSESLSIAKTGISPILPDAETKPRAASPPAITLNTAAAAPYANTGPSSRQGGAPSQARNPYRPLTPTSQLDRAATSPVDYTSRDGLVRNAAPLGMTDDRRQPTLPNLSGLGLAGGPPRYGNGPQGYRPGPPRPPQQQRGGYGPPQPRLQPGPQGYGQRPYGGPQAGVYAGRGGYGGYSASAFRGPPSRGGY